MSEIKSEKAKEALRTLTLNKPNIDYCLAKNVVNGTLYRDIERIAELAETEAEERHAKQLQKLRDRAMEAHRAICINTKCQSNTAYDKGFGNNQCSGNCAYVKQFAQKLTEN